MPEILNSDGTVRWRTDTYDHWGGPPIEVTLDRFLFRNRQGEFVIDGPGASAPQRTHAAVGEPLSRPPVRLSSGEVLLAFPSGKIQILSKEGNVLFEETLPASIWESPVLLKDGTLIIVSRDGTVHAIDRNLIDGR